LVIDVDGPAGAATAAALGVPDDTLTVTTGRLDGGCHHYFTVPTALPDGAPLLVGNRQLGPRLDVRHACGYVLAPPSVHPSGAHYQWTRRRPPAPLPEALLARLLAPTAVTDRPAVDAAPAVAFGAVPARRPARPVLSADAALRRAWARARCVPCGLSDGRKRLAFQLVTLLLYDAQLGAADAAEVLQWWNAGHMPPLDAATLARIASDAAKYGRARGDARGWAA
jgi:hypothetical protein